MRAHTYFLLFFCFSSTLFGQSSKIDSLIDQANMYNNSDLEQALSFANQAIALAEAQGSAAEQGRAILVKGRTYANMGELDAALSFFLDAKTYFQRSADSAGLADVHTKLQYAHLYMGQTDSALYHALQALRLYESQGDQKGMAVALFKASETLNSQANFEKAVEYGKRSVSLAEELNDSLLLAETLSTVAVAYLSLEAYELALSYANRSTEIYEAKQTDVNIAISLNQRGNIYKLAGQYEPAVQDYERGLAIAASFNYPGLDRALRSNLADVTVKMGRYEEGVTQLLEVKKLDKLLGYTRDKPETYLHLATAYAGLGQYDSAYIYRIQFDELKDSLYTEESDRNLSEIRTQYETEKVEAENQILEQEKQQQSLLLWASALVILAIAVIATLLYRNNERRKRTNALLGQQKTEIEQKNQQNETLLKEIHHRVKNNLQVISSLLRLQTSDIKDEAVRKVVAAGEHRVKSMALIHQKLYQRENLSGVEMKDYLSSLAKSLIDTLGEKGKSIALNVDMPELELDVDTAVPMGLIANELITNSLKYAFANRDTGMIRLSLGLNAQKMLQLTVSDDGVGEGEISIVGGKSSFGTRLIHLLCMQMDGQVSIDTSTGRSTHVAVRDFQILSS